VGGEEVVEADLLAVRAGWKHDDLDLRAAPAQVAGQSIERPAHGLLHGDVAVERNQDLPTLERDELPFGQRGAVRHPPSTPPSPIAARPTDTAPVCFQDSLREQERHRDVEDPLARQRVDVEHVRLVRTAPGTSRFSRP